MRWTLLLFLVACGHAAPPPAIGNGTASDAPSCDPAAAPLYTDQRWAIHANPPPNEQPGQTITIRDSGAWSVEGEDAASGCLTADELHSLRDGLGAATLAPEGGIHCDAMPVARNQDSFGGGTIEWESPCGQSPDAASERTIGCAWDLTIHRASPTGACQ